MVINPAALVWESLNERITQLEQGAAGVPVVVDDRAIAVVRPAA